MRPAPSGRSTARLRRPSASERPRSVRIRASPSCWSPVAASTRQVSVHGPLPPRRHPIRDRPLVSVDRAAEGENVTGECWISVDVETSGPTPSTGSLVAIGACLPARSGPDRTFSIELQPLPDRPWSDEAEGIHRLTRERLAGAPEPAAAIGAFATWVEREAGCGPRSFRGVQRAVRLDVGRGLFLAISRPQSVRGERARHQGVVPGAGGCPRSSAGRRRRRATTSRPRFPVDLPHTHAALDDAIEQASMCRRIVAGS